MSNLSYMDELLVYFHNECNESIMMYELTLRLYNDIEEYSDKMRDMIIEYIILQLFAKWETFLEKIFIAYMLGEKSANGDSVKRYVEPINEEHAYKIVKNVNQYPDWSKVDEILINAENFFEKGGAFVVLKTTKGYLGELKKVRNGIAHVSKKSKKDFENLVLGKLGKLPTEITPAKFLINHKIGKRKKDPTHFEFYVGYLKDVATMLVEFKVEQNLV